MTDPVTRQADLEQIKATYSAYESEGRTALWDASNRGYARMMRDRDAALVDVIAWSASAGDQLLDLGCGTGEIAELMRPLGIWVTGVDLRPEAIAVASARYPEADWRVGSADELPFGDSTFDVLVLSTLVSSLSPGLQESVAREASRVLRPDGFVAWYDLRYDNPRNRAVRGVGRQRIAELFPGWLQTLRSITLLPPLSRRLGPATALMYPALHLIPQLRSHLVGGLYQPTARVLPHGRQSHQSSRAPASVGSTAASTDLPPGSPSRAGPTA